ncbi:proline-rich receptor-like protein kinase PERK8 [Fukomys damarensis]|uniref:proline-rich receptor-like protein kinase PERK8 n=1 Tax=Fukomys damarensis TaxID=885580 RepID=UPI001455A9D1|nr:proline-rich receptor-like protein kinase PERK8 [Fukomys damarensis]
MTILLIAIFAAITDLLIFRPTPFWVFPPSTPLLLTPPTQPDPADDPPPYRTAKNPLTPPSTPSDSSPPPESPTPPISSDSDHPTLCPASLPSPPGLCASPDSLQ